MGFLAGDVPGTRLGEKLLADCGILSAGATMSAELLLLLPETVFRHLSPQGAASGPSQHPHAELVAARSSLGASLLIFINDISSPTFSRSLASSCIHVLKN